ncbi:glyoxalase [Pandoraea captiosa]|uniref:Glyoxalase n=1 Tax=Pandoraea captiosa TaxID=2508302 RepID=A0A5E4ZI98_9BURK|nr:ArsI/CadI family heavy metal resistance metalloenzyme [Pandoraea captiosa]VVE60548.1 glyoxalase [Pandoraea captiosa]
MKRFHVHVSVADLPTSIRFYSALFHSAPDIVRNDYAKWVLDDPRVNFAISNRTESLGVDHLGIQADTATELGDLRDRMVAAGLPMQSQSDAHCCYVTSNKHWSVDPQGVAWETFHTLDSAPTYGESRHRMSENAACCAPAQSTDASEARMGTPCCSPTAHCR